MSALATALAIALATPVTAAPQTLARADPVYDAHLRAVRIERTRAFFTEWKAAPEAARRRAAALLAERRHPGAPLGARPSLGALAAARRELTLQRGQALSDEEEGGSSPGSADDLASAAAALDSMVVPGFFEARAEGRGEPVTVRLHPLYPAPPPGDVTVTLFWQSPDGARTRARTERAARSAFERPGFDLFVRAPLSAPGTWTLVAELEDTASGASALSEPVAVECIQEASERLGRLRALAEGGEPAEELLLAELEALRSYGVRTARGLSPSEELRRLEMGARGGPWPALTEPAPPVVRERLPHFVRAWFQLPPGEPERVVLFLAASQESADSFFALADLHGWNELARRRGAVLVSGQLALGGEATPVRLVTELRRRFPDRPVVLAVGGDAVSRLGFALLRGAALDVDALIVNGDSPALAPNLPRVPTLHVHPSAPDAPGESADEGRVDRVRGGASSFLAQAELAALVERWLTDAGL